jgi:hypothetical protein
LYNYISIRRKIKRESGRQLFRQGRFRRCKREFYEVKDNGRKDLIIRDAQPLSPSSYRAISSCIDAIVRSLEQAYDPQLIQMTRLSWGIMDTVGDQSDYVSQMLDLIKRHVTVVGRIVANKRYFRTFNDRFAE